MSKAKELELETGEPFAQLSCQAFEAPDETCMCRFEARQASAERAGMAWLANLGFGKLQKVPCTRRIAVSSLKYLVYTASFAVQRVFTSGATLATIWRQHSVAWQH